MQRNFTDENFERFLQQNADGLRMKPSEKVWKGIDAHLNKKKKRFGFFLGFSILLTSALGYFYFNENNTAAVQNETAAGDETRGQSTMAPGKESTDLRSDRGGAVEVQMVQSPVINAPVPNASSGSQISARVIPMNTIAAATLSGSNSSVAQLGADRSLFENSSAAGTESRSGSIAANADVLSSNTFIPTIVDSYPDTDREASPLAKKDAAVMSNLPMTIESVTNSYKRLLKNKKFGVQFFFTPTVSYRRLAENKAYARSTGNQQVYSINSAVTHKPDFGFKVGVMGKYAVGSRFKIRGGVQFNVNRYDIKTFNSSYEVATIQFSDRQTLNAVTGYNNFSGYKSDWLENFYFQVAAPVGVEMRVSGNRKTTLGIAANVAPTYILGDKTYLISKDYKNYIEVPWLVRDWNVNTSFETFVGYSTGKVKWQVGPQVSYQMFSTYDSRYPIKEHLFDFGLRVGMSLKK